MLTVSALQFKISYEEKMEDFFKYGIWAEDFKDINIKGLLPLRLLQQKRH